MDSDQENQATTASEDNPSSNSSESSVDTQQDFSDLSVDELKSRLKERTSWDGAVCIALGLMILFLSPLAKIAAGLAIAYGIWTIWKAE